MAEKKQSVAPAAAKQAADQDVVFARAWRHGGKDYKSGGKATVTAAAKDKLQGRGAIKS